MLKKTSCDVIVTHPESVAEFIETDLLSVGADAKGSSQFKPVERSKHQSLLNAVGIFLGSRTVGLTYIEREKKTGVGINHHKLSSRISSTPFPFKTFPL